MVGGADAVLVETGHGGIADRHPAIAIKASGAADGDAGRAAAQASRQQRCCQALGFKEFRHGFSAQAAAEERDVEIVALWD